MSLLDVDQSIFYAINGMKVPLLLEEFMIISRKGSTWIPLYVILASWLIYRFRLTGLWIALAVAACAGAPRIRCPDKPESGF